MRWLFVAIAVVFVGLAMTPSAPAQTSSDVQCAALGSNPTREQLDNFHLCQEIANLQETNKQLQRTNASLSGPGGVFLPWANVLTGAAGVVVGFLVTLLGWMINTTLRKRESDRLEQEKFLKLMEGVGSKEKTLQLASTSALLRRYEEVRDRRKWWNPAWRQTTPTSEMKTIQDVFIAVLRDSTPDVDSIDPDVSKYIADGLVRAFGVQNQAVRRHDQTEPATKRRAPVSRTFDFADQKLEGAQLHKVFWAGVAAEGVDFYQADLTEASLRDSWLKSAVFYEAKMDRCVLRRADLRTANFMGASLRGADLRDAVADGANFTGADFRGHVGKDGKVQKTRLKGADLSHTTGLDSARFDIETDYDASTKWPDDRRPGNGYEFFGEPEPVTRE